jgi:very-short-patch-repair endonuclease
LRAGRFEGWKFRRQHPVGPYFADFYCARAKLVVELDGSQHIEASEYDDRRTRAMEDRGLRVIRYFNHDVQSRMDAVLDDIFAWIGKG